MKVLTAVHRRVHGKRRVLLAVVASVAITLTLYPRPAEAQSGRHVRNGYSYMCMAIRAATAGPGAPVFQHDCVTNWTDQQWITAYRPSGPYAAYRFYNKFDSRLGLASSSGYAVVEPYPGPLYEKIPISWRSGFFQLRRQYTDRCLAIWHNFDNGAPVFEAPCNQSYGDQHWYWW